MKKIGILTFWGVPNYGAFAQAYALNRIIQSLESNAEVVHMAYLDPAHKKLYFQKRKPKMERKKDLINPFFYWSYIKYIIDKNIYYPNFEKDWNKIPHTLIETKERLETEKWDVIITGSDAIWEYSIKEFGDDIHLIGNQLNCIRLYSYAASFGEMEINDNFPHFVIEGLQNYQKISVRDNMSYDIIKKLTGIEAEILLDPTLLYNFREDDNIPQPEYDEYILVYGNNFPPFIINEVKEYALKNHLLIIGAGIAPEWCDYRLIDLGPLQWIGMFSKAEFVVTCTFHGLMFSINYNKKVLFNQIIYTKNRSEWLLEQLGLRELYAKEVSLQKVLGFKWDYKKINQKLETLKKKSFLYLREALNYE